MTPETWMFLGYAAIWTGLIAFVMNMRRRQESLERQIEDLEKAVAARK